MATPEQQSKEELTLANIADRISADSEKENGGGLTLYKTPKFKKPISLLDENLTPFLKVRFIVQSEDPDGTISQYPFGQVFDIPYNNLRSFKVSVGSEASSVELSITDTSSIMMEYFLLTFYNIEQSSSMPLMEIEFGWSVPAELKKLEDYFSKGTAGSGGTKTQTRPIYFTNTLVATIEDIKTEFENGVINATIMGTFNDVGNGIISKNKPWTSLGTNPVIDYIFFKLFTINSDDENERKKQYISVLKLLNSLKSIDKEQKYNLALCAALALNNVFYLDIKSTNSAYIKDNKLDTVKIKSEKDLTYVLRESIPEGLKDKLSKYIYLDESNKTSLYSQFAEKNSTNAVVAAQQFITEDALQDVGKSIINYKEILSSFSINEYRRFDELTGKFTNASNNNTLSVIGKVKSFMMPILNDIKVHPFEVLILATQSIEDTYKKIINAKKLKDANTQTSTPGNPTPLEDSDNIIIFMPIDPNRILGISENITPNSISQKANDPFCIPAKNITLDGTESWKDFIKKVASEIKIGFTKDDADKLKGVGIAPISLADGPYKDIKNLKYSKGQIDSYMSMEPTVISVSGDKATIEKTYKKLETVFSLKKFEAINPDPKSSTAVQLVNAINKLGFEKYRNIKTESRHSVTFIVLGLSNVDVLFNAELAGERVLQSYSFGGFTATDGFFEPLNISSENGINKTALDINYPDVISFKPEFNFKSAVENSIETQNATYNQSRGGAEDISINDLKTKSADEIKAEDEAKKKQEEEMKKLDPKDRVSKLQAETNEANSSIGAELSQNFTNAIFAPRFSPRLNLNLDRTNITLPGTAEADVANAKRVVENMRRLSALSGKDIIATMVVIGDPSFLMESSGKYIYVKHSNIEGQLTQFTGLYLINNITHELSAGKFTTTFELRKESTNANLNAQINKSFKTEVISRNILRELCGLLSKDIEAIEKQNKERTNQITNLNKQIEQQPKNSKPK